MDRKFIVDTMLGDVARWLRMLGYDTLYSSKLSDPQILEIAAKEERIIITRDRGLYARAKKRGLKAVLVPDGSVAERLAAISKYIELPDTLDPSRSRCPVCNGELRRASVEEVKAKVPEGVIARVNEFWVCVRCGKVYWKGGHWRGIERTLREAKRLSSTARTLQ